MQLYVWAVILASLANASSLKVELIKKKRSCDCWMSSLNDFSEWKQNHCTEKPNQSKCINVHVPLWTNTNHRNALVHGIHACLFLFNRPTAEPKMCLASRALIYNMWGPSTDPLYSSLGPFSDFRHRVFW